VTTSASASLSKLTSVLFDPLSWLPPTCLPFVIPAQWLALCEASHVVRPVAWINQVILDTHALACTTDDERCDSNIRVWIDSWRHLRRAAYLAGCRCLRDDLVATGRFGHLEPAARHFALLPLVVPRACLELRARLREDPAVLVAQGYLCLFQQATRSPTEAAMPLALRQRLCLLFADARALIDRVAPSISEAASHTVFPTLFDTAILHAQIHQNAYTADCD
jgi:type III secretion system OrgA/MxiK family protein